MEIRLVPETSIPSKCDNKRTIKCSFVVVKDTKYKVIETRIRGKVTELVLFGYYPVLVVTDSLYSLEGDTLTLET